MYRLWLQRAPECCQNVEPSRQRSLFHRQIRGLPCVLSIRLLRRLPAKYMNRPDAGRIRLRVRGETMLYLYQVSLAVFVNYVQDEGTETCQTEVSLQMRSRNSRTVLHEGETETIEL